jgi:chromosome segregation ATPase
VANEQEIAKQLQDAKDALDAALNPPDGVDPPTTEEIQALEDKVAELEKSLEDAQKATADAETAMNDAEADAVAALEDAANKPVDDEVRAEVDRLLDGKFPPADPDPVTTDPSGAI